jgi:predicted CoA-binding protein
MTTMNTIREFLGHKRLAVVGVSHDSREFSRLLYSELRQRGYDAVPVNPRTSEIEGERCFPRLQDVQPTVSSALLMTSASVTESVVRDCIAAGVKRIWMYRGGGRGSATPEAVRLCEENEIAVIPGECPLMFLPDAGWIHRLHRFAKKVVHTYPC